MFNEPMWASEEELDIYAWFGFAMQEAQGLEQMLLIINVAFDIKNGVVSKGNSWTCLYDKLGRLTLGQLLSRIRKHSVCSEDFEFNLKNAVDVRNKLAHTFFFTNSSKNKSGVNIRSKKELMETASLFSNLKPQLETIMGELLFNLGIEKDEAERQTTILLDKSMSRPPIANKSLNPTA